jgi:ligand-binding sensor domain-containing protein
LDNGSTKFEHYQYQTDDADSLSSDNVVSVIEDADGIIWAGTMQGGLNQYDSEKDSFIRHVPSDTDLNTLSHIQIWDLFVDRKGILWIGTRDGLCSYASNQANFIRYPMVGNSKNRHFSPWITDIFQDSKGRYWVGTHGGGLNLFDPEKGTYQVLTTEEGLADNVVCEILEDQQGFLWISTEWH